MNKTTIKYPFYSIAIDLGKKSALNVHEKNQSKMKLVLMTGQKSMHTF